MLTKISNPADQCRLKFDSEGDEGVFSGYASVFNKSDKVNDTILPGAFGKTLKGDISRVKMFWNHDHHMIPVGLWKSMTEDDYGLKVEGLIDLNHIMGPSLLSAMKLGTIDGLSIGFKAGKDDYTQKDDDDPYSGRIYKGVELVETSIVTFPCDQNATIEAVKLEEFDLQTIRDFENCLRDAGGFSKKAARTFLGRLKALLRSDSASEDEQQTIEGQKRIVSQFAKTLNRISEL